MVSSECFAPEWTLWVSVARTDLMAGPNLRQVGKAMNLQEVENQQLENIANVQMGGQRLLEIGIFPLGKKSWL